MLLLVLLLVLLLALPQLLVLTSLLQTWEPRWRAGHGPLALRTAGLKLVGEPGAVLSSSLSGRWIGRGSMARPPCAVAVYAVGVEIHNVAVRGGDALIVDRFTDMPPPRPKELTEDEMLLLQWQGGEQKGIKKVNVTNRNVSATLVGCDLGGAVYSRSGGLAGFGLSLESCSLHHSLSDGLRVMTGCSLRVQGGSIKVMLVLLLLVLTLLVLLLLVLTPVLRKAATKAGLRVEIVLPAADRRDGDASVVLDAVEISDNGDFGLHVLGLVRTTLVLLLALLLALLLLLALTFLLQCSVGGAMTVAHNGEGGCLANGSEGQGVITVCAASEFICADNTHTGNGMAPVDLAVEREGRIEGVEQGEVGRV